MAGRSIIVMGVSGSGKTTVGEAVARRIHAKFIDGDDLHPRANIQKMGSGHPLNDEDRMPWLERLSDAAYSLHHKNESGIIVCSALKRRYRDRLREGNPEMVFLYLKGSFNVIMERLKARSGHFMPTDLLKSQFEALEEPGSEEPDVICVDIDADIDEVVQRCVLALEKQN
ncbi:putative gluconokinase [Yersinia enterocolitica]|uniref:Gluconokinase n=1 Tax=Yersinia enterocolitica serotype O:8 / biotype 1B (strain NCTC 13174 / 8081) TaxID=393305 RepID=A1JSK0_YERE8|nr:gluconokinase [Yersinia enterocolitica]AJI83890.1 carbohydrate kinase, thermoresistant glucokinase family protein [Yersinia enterocolitica]AJJ24527.1 carbohydrate kinase, thermoresistant glucokinase family protein [Yersinia enterocolitica]EKA25923.1 gluconokinase [Yersinia enterocolitica subsp. enterocolitica WA-314]ELI8283415.1 gluconokinase [Yersinia enterocolitica]KGA68905.1 carbohydrate kinase, thermoresistant glucokinase family protein [Yersinia enterocolitica]